MSNLEELRKEAEKTDQAAVKLSAEYQDKIDKQVTKKWQELKERYGDRLNEANQEAADAQKRYMDALAINDLLDRPDGKTVADRLVGEGGLSADAVAEAFPEAADES